MTVYMVCIFIILFLGVALLPQSSKQRKNVFLFISFLILVPLAGLRDFSVGVDTINYINLYENIEYYNMSSTRFEKGFIYFLKFLYNISDNPGFLLIVVAVINVGCTLYFIKKFSKNPTISVLLYVLLRFYFTQFNTMRDGIAGSISLIAFSFVMNNRDKKRIFISALLLLFACMTHTVACVAFIPFLILVLPIMQKIIIDKITPGMCIKWSIILSVCAFILFSTIMKIVSHIFPQYVFYLSGTWSDSNYVASLIGVLMLLAFLFVGYIFMRARQLDRIEKFALLMLSLAIIVSTLSIHMEIWSRVISYFSIYTALIWAPAFLQNINKKNQLIGKCAVIGFSWLYLIVVLIFRPEWDGVVPYLLR